MLEASAYEDDGLQSAAPAGGWPGYALGCTAEKRLSVVLHEHGFTAIAAAATPGSFGALLEAARDENVERWMRVVQLLSADGRWHVRSSLATHLPVYVPGVFEMLGHDPISCVRQSVAGNPHTPFALRERLLNDSDSVVVLAAKQRL